MLFLVDDLKVLCNNNCSLYFLKIWSICVWDFLELETPLILFLLYLETFNTEYEYEVLLNV